MCDFYIYSISRLFTDAKKILLYSQHDKSFEGFKGLVRALRKLQSKTEGTSMWSLLFANLGIENRFFLGPSGTYYELLAKPQRVCFSSNPE